MSVLQRDRVEILAATRRSLAAAPGAEIAPAAFVQALRRNKLPLLSLVGATGTAIGGDAHEQARALLAPSAESMSDPDLLPLLRSGEFARALAEDIGAYQEAHGEYARLAEAWSAAGVTCICFKSAGIAPSFPYTSDNIDILVPSSALLTARRVLRAVGYVELRNCEEPRKWLFRRFVAGRSVSAIHLHTQVGWGQGYMVEDTLWPRAVRSQDDPWTWVPAREDAALINLAHAWVENKEITLHDLWKIRHALDGPVDWRYMFGVAEERGWSDGLRFALLLAAQLESALFGCSVVPADVREQCEDAVRGTIWLDRSWNRLRQQPPSLPRPIPFVVSKALHFQKLWRDRHLALGEKPAETALELVRGAQQKLHLWPQDAMLIALSGPDGSGKTSHARALAQAFTTSAIRNRVVWTRLGATPLLHTLATIKYRRAQGGAGHAAQAPRPVAHAFDRRGWRLASWAVAAGTDYVMWLLYVRWRLLRGDVVIADRFLCDFDVELSLRLEDWPRLLSAVRAAVRRAAPRPDCAYYLRIAPDAASRRLLALDGGYTDDIPPEEQCARYERLYTHYDLCAIDAGMPQGDVASTIVHDALTRFMDRFAPLGNVLLFANSWQLNPTLSRSQEAISGNGNRRT